jgi:hypothetical protein
VFVDMKHKLNDPDVRRIMAYALFDGSPEGIYKEVALHYNDAASVIHAC